MPAARISRCIWIRKKGVIQVFSQSRQATGEPQGRRGSSPVKSPALPGLSLANVRGDLRLEWLRIARWSGEPPRDVKADQSRIHRATARSSMARSPDSTPAPRSSCSERFGGIADRGRQDLQRVPVAPGEEKTRSIRAVYQDGSRLSGNLERSKMGVSDEIPGHQGIAAAAGGRPASLVVLKHPDQARWPRRNRPAASSSTGLRLPGKLVDGREQPGSSCLAWQPARL